MEITDEIRSTIKLFTYKNLRKLPDGDQREVLAAIFQRVSKFYDPKRGKLSAYVGAMCSRLVAEKLLDRVVENRPAGGAE